MDEQQASETPTPEQNPNGGAPPPLISGWTLFDGQVVVLQLEEEYIGVSYPAEIMVTKEGKWVRTPILRGLLRVLPSGDGGILLVVHIPDPGTQTEAFITLHPSDVKHCTHVEKREQPRIVTQ